MGTMGSLVRELGLLFFLHCVVGDTSRSSMGPDVNSTDQLVKMNSTEITAVTPRGPTMSERISNPFRSIVLEENSGITKPPEIETVIIEEIIPFTVLAEFTDIADIASNTIEREGTPIENTALTETLTTVSPIIEATKLTSNSIDNSSTFDNTQEIETTTAVSLSIDYTNPEEETVSLEIGTSAETLGVADNNLQSKIITEETTLTGDITETVGTTAKTTSLPGTSVTINGSSEEGTSTLLNTIFFSGTSVSSSSAEEESSASVETLTETDTITMVLSTTGETSNAVETLDTTGHTVETTDKMTTNTLNTIYIPTTEETTAVFTEVPTVMYSTEERSTITKFITTAEFSDKGTEGTTPGHDGGFLLFRLVVYSSLDLTDFKVAKEFLNKFHQDLQVQVPYTQISLMRVTRD
ncbi:mucin-20 isoform X2 [Macrotis lagotis]|uniref:mucin-20 isoform X2 n=1 Tax=Macrotis lagotis TaxID=92651 RepID=UPI003D68AF41